MEYQIKVGRINRVIETNDSGQIESIDQTSVEDIDDEELKECAIALAKYQLDQGYKNSQDISMIDDREALRVERYIDERRGK